METIWTSYDIYFVYEDAKWERNTELVDSTQSMH
jgi:hypothetical protein